MPTPFKAVIFDFDGTIADSLPQSIIVFNKLASVYGYRPITDEMLPRARMMSTRKFVKHFKIAPLKIPSMLQEGKRIIHSRIEHIHPFEHMREIISQLLEDKDLLVGILTSNSKENVQKFCELHHFPKVNFICSQKGLSKKSKALRSISRTFTIEPQHMLYIGDEKRDIRASHRTGVQSTAVGWGFNTLQALEKELPSYSVKNTSELRKLLQI